MKLQTQAGTRRWLPFLAAGLTYLLFLLLARGFVTSGDDWYFTSRTMDEGLLGALNRGVDSALGHYRTVNGRLLGNAFSAFFGSSEFWREIVRCGILLAVVLLICRLAQVRSLTGYVLTVTLTVALPPVLYAQSYAWAAGFFNYVPPILALLVYILRADRVLAGEKDGPVMGLGLMALAFAAQLFAENISVGMCLLSGCVLIWQLVREKRLSWSLSGYFAGAAAGLAVMLSAPGYSNINQENYRQVSGDLAQMINTIQNNFFQVTGYLTENNWVIIGGLTVVCLLLLHRVKEKHWLRNAAMLCLVVCPVYFYANSSILSQVRYIHWIGRLSFLLDAAANLGYLLAVLTTVLLAVEEPGRQRRCVLCILAVPLLFGPLLVVNPIGPRCLYIPYMLLVCLLALLAGELPKEPLKQLRAPVLMMCGCVLVVYLWVGLLNGHCEGVRLDMIHSAMESGADIVTLPSYPYMDYVHNGNGGAMRYYFYYEDPADLTFEFVPHDQWVNGSK